MTRIQMTPEMKEAIEPGMYRAKVTHVLVMADGKFWRGNDAKPVKSKSHAALITHKEGLAMLEAYPAETSHVRTYYDR